MLIRMDRNLGDAIRIVETIIEDRDEFNKFIDQLLIAAKTIWPEPETVLANERDAKGRFKRAHNETT